MASSFLGLSRLLWSSLLWAALFPALAETLDFPHIDVSGHGEVLVVPDIVALDLAVVETGTDLAATKAVVDGNAAQVLEKVEARGIGAADINATRLMIVPEYQWDGQKRVFQGYRVSQEIHLRLRDTALYAELLSDLVSAGITELTNTRLDTSRRQALQDEALVRAAADARRKAESIAAELGAGLGQVFSVTEVSANGGPSPMVRGEVMAMAADSQSVFEPGTLAISRTVRAVFRLDVGP